VNVETTELWDAAHAWWHDHAPPSWTDEQHAPHPWLNLFGPEETQLSVAIGQMILHTGTLDQFIQAAVKWYGASDPCSVPGIRLHTAVEQFLKTRSADADDNSEGEVMEANIVILKGRCTRYANSMAEAREYRDLICTGFDVPKKLVTIEPCAIPTHKADLVAYLNDLLTRYDAAQEEGAK
jgi:hypothetical protein